MASPNDAGTDPVLKPIGRFEWERIIRRLTIPSQQKYLALVLATYADPDGSRVRPGVKRLARVMSLTERTVVRSLNPLRELGLLERTKKGNRYAEESDEYRLTVPLNLLDLPMLSPDEEGESK